jgi:hypothetical protein
MPPFREGTFGLIRDISDRFKRANPEAPVNQTTMVAPDKDDHNPLPLGGDDSTFHYYQQKIRLLKQRKDLFAEYDEMDSPSARSSHAG